MVKKMKNYSINEFIDYIKKYITENEKTIIGVDGRCGSGKSTLAKNLQDKLGFEVIHVDDFYLPLNMRTKERFSVIGGNIHSERFHAEVIDGIMSGKNYSYTKFDISTLDFGEVVNIDHTKPLIIEGAYSLKEDFRHIYTLKCFMDIDKETQANRIIARNGEEDYQNFKNMWIPREEAYISTCNIENVCSIRIDGSSF